MEITKNKTIQSKWKDHKTDQKNDRKLRKPHIGSLQRLARSNNSQESRQEKKRHK